MIPVLSLRYHPAVGGVETRVLEVTTRLKSSFDLKVVTSDLMTERPYQKLDGNEQLTEYMGVPITRLKSRKFLPVEGYGVILKGLKGALLGSEMIHTHTYGTYHTDMAVRIAKGMNVPSLLTTHLHPAFASHHKMLRTVYDSLWGKSALKKSAHIITMTEIERDYLAKRFKIPKTKMTSIPSGIDLSKFRDLGYEREENLLLFVGRMSPVKRLDMLLRAVAKVKRRIPDVSLRIIGRDWGVKSDLAALAGELKIKDNVQFMGEIPFESLVEQYNRAKLLVLTSGYEALGLTLMEAIGCQTPVVATGVGGVPEVVGDTGSLCQENEESVAAGIIELLTNDEKYNILRENTKRRRALFSWEIVADKVRSIYERTLETS